MVICYIRLAENIYQSQLDVQPTQQSLWRCWFLFFLFLLLMVKKISQADLRAGLWTKQTWWTAYKYPWFSTLVLLWCRHREKSLNYVRSNRSMTWKNYGLFGQFGPNLVGTEKETEQVSNINKNCFIILFVSNNADRDLTTSSILEAALLFEIWQHNTSSPQWCPFTAHKVDRELYWWYILSQEISRYPS